MNALDPRLVEDVANRRDTDEGLVEKDWHVVRAISVIAALDHVGMQPAFSDGTSLSAAWGLIKRSSQDTDILNDFVSILFAPCQFVLPFMQSQCESDVYV